MRSAVTRDALTGVLAVCCLYGADPVSFDRIGLQNGLSQGSIRCMYQDRQGYLWFGTQDGLNRYDGYGFKVYRNSADDPQSLPNNSISSIVEDRRGNLWIATTGGGVGVLNRSTGKFTRFAADPKNADSLSDNATHAVLEDPDGYVWIATQFGGLNRFDPASGKFRHYRHNPGNPATLSSDDIMRLLDDRAGGLWIATRDRGLNHLDRKTGAIVRYAGELPDGRVLSLHVDRAGHLLVGTGRGAGYFDAGAGRYTRLAMPSGADEIWAIVEDKAGDLWFGSQAGLDRLDKEGSWTAYRNDVNDARSLSSQTVLSILEDRSGTLWFGANRGVNRLSAASRRFVTFRRGARSGLTAYSMHGIYEDASGVVWSGTDRGLNRYDPRTGEFSAVRHVPGNAASLPNDIVSSVGEGPSKGHLWLGTAAGLVDFDTASGRTRTWRSDPLDERSLSDDSVALVLPEPGGAVWVGTRTGLNRFDPKSGKFTRFLHDVARTTSIAGNEIRALATDTDGTYWIGTRHHGLDRFDPRTGVFEHFAHNPKDARALSAPAVYALHVDRRRRVWVGTTAGLNLLNRETGAFEHFTMKDGLPNDTVYAILEDGDGKLWMSTNAGLARLDPETRKFRVFDVGSGLQDNEFNGASAFYSRATERMYFGGVNGYNRFEPDKVADSAFEPPVVLTSFQVGGSPVAGAAEQGRAELSWKDSMFTIGFASLDYSAPGLNRFAYRLEPFDRDWQSPIDSRFATYTNLDSGTYTFNVRGTNSDGVWSGREAKMRIEIVPPPWKRWWFLSGLAFVLGGCVIWAYRARVARYSAAQDTQERFSRLLIASQEAERKRIAAELHDSLGQNLIVIRNLALLGLAKAGDAENSAHKLEEISEAASEAIDEVRELARNLRPQQLERLGLTSALKSLATRAANASNIEFESSIDEVDGVLDKDGEINFYRIVQESVNNILKHSEATAAGIEVRRGATGITLRIHDNGKGLEAAQDSVERGFGLAGIAERARILGARHRIESAPGKGTAIVLEMDIAEDRQ